MSLLMIFTLIIWPSCVIMICAFIHGCVKAEREIQSSSPSADEKQTSTPGLAQVHVLRTDRN
jgi:hypothetical protein